MSICRIFMDWSTPALPSTAEYLCTRYASDGVLDLQRTIVVLPGAWAGRRLLKLLVTGTVPGDVCGAYDPGSQRVAVSVVRSADPDRACTLYDHCAVLPRDSCSYR